MKTNLFIKNGLLTAFILLISYASTFAVTVTVNFKTSTGVAIPGSNVIYYDYSGPGWTSFGITDINGQVVGDITPNGIDQAVVKIYYDGRSKTLVQNILTNSVFNFSTIAVTMKLVNSLDEDLVSTNARYNSGGWKQFGSGNTPETIELLGGNYTFKVYYNESSNIKTQNISIDPIVIFKTANTTLYFTGDISYFTSAFHTFNGPSIELLPNIYQFRFEGSGYDIIDMFINITEDGIEKSVEYVKLTSSLGSGINGASTQFNSTGWEAGNPTVYQGSCVNLIEGYVEEVTTRLYYGGTLEDIVQNIQDDSFVDFNTVLVSMDLNNSIGDPLASSNAEYYANGWQQFGGGVTSESIELLAQDYNFRVSYANGSKSKHQDVSVDADVVFETVAVTANLFDSDGNDLVSDDVTYSNDGTSWAQFGDGMTSETAELLADDYIFRLEYAGATIDKDQDVGDHAVVDFATVPVTMNVYDEDGNVLVGTDAMYNFSGWTTFGGGLTPETVELLPVVYDFKASYDEDELTVNQNTAFDPNVSFTLESGLELALIDLEGDEDVFKDDDEMMGVDVDYEKSAAETDIEDAEIPNSIVYPNPFSESVTVSYLVEMDAKVNISIYNVHGKLITTLVNHNMDKGVYEVKWNADDSNGSIVPNGTYIYKITIGDKVESNTLILQK